MTKQILSTKFHTVITIQILLYDSALTQQMGRLETTERPFIREIEDYKMEVNKINEDITE